MNKNKVHEILAARERTAWYADTAVHSLNAWTDLFAGELPVDGDTIALLRSAA